MSPYRPLHHMINDTNARNPDSVFSLVLSFQYPDQSHDFNAATILITRYTCTKRRLEACLLSLRHLLRLTAHLHLWLGCVAIRQLLAATLSSYSHDMTCAVRTHLVISCPPKAMAQNHLQSCQKFEKNGHMQMCATENLWESRPGTC